jgi:hypothetical protein
MVHKNPFSNPERPPEWAQLSRLAGDRAAVRFEELREQISNIEGLVEELQWFGPELGWMPRYRVGSKTLFAVSIMPGTLEASLELDSAGCECALAARRVPAALKSAIRAAAEVSDPAIVRLKLTNKASVRAIASLVHFLSKSALGQ